MSRFDAYGVAFHVPAGWEARASSPAPHAAIGVEEPYVHAASFALPSTRAPYGGAAVTDIGVRDLFVALVEFAPTSASTPLFRRRGAPTGLRAGDFSPATLQRVVRGQAGVQRFFSIEGRAFSLYVVAGGNAAVRVRIHELNALLSSLDVRSRAPTS